MVRMLGRTCGYIFWGLGRGGLNQRRRSGMVAFVIGADHHDSGIAVIKLVSDKPMFS